MTQIGIDLGGKSIKCAVVEGGKILDARCVSTPAEKDYNVVVSQIANLVNELAQENMPDRIGMGVPGLIDSVQGTVLFSNNFDWYEKQIAADLAAKTGFPIRIANDAQTAALGEALYGAGRGFSRMAMITLGTGVGGGFIVNGKPETGLYGSMAGILGHMLYKPDGFPCNCGRKGCYEGYCSATAIERNYFNASGMRKSAREIFEAMQNEPAAQQAVNIFKDALLELVADIGNALRPEIIVIGGGVSGASAIFMDEVNNMLHNSIYGFDYAPVKAVPAILGNNAGIIGAANLKTTEHRS